MITPETFTEEHIRNIQQSTKRDPALIERTIFALGLLEALARSELTFIFKGGTSLLLLLGKILRLSVDVDLILEVAKPNIDTPTPHTPSIARSV